MTYEELCGCSGSCNPENKLDGNTDPNFPFTCEDKPFPFSSDELEIFDHLLTIKREVKELQRRIDELDAKTPSNDDQAALVLDEKSAYNDRITALRREWAEWKQQSEIAAVKRMIALGHVDPETQQ